MSGDRTEIALCSPSSPCCLPRRDLPPASVLVAYWRCYRAARCGKRQQNVIAVQGGLLLVRAPKHNDCGRNSTGEGIHKLIRMLSCLTGLWGPRRPECRACHCQTGLVRRFRPRAPWLSECHSRAMFIACERPRATAGAVPRVMESGEREVTSKA